MFSYYKQYGREFPFREKIDPYHVVVSEVMLQQTQTGTVSEKFLNFIRLFPDFEALAKAPLKKVLKAWQGLGYNKRAIGLQKTAKLIVKEHHGKVPKSRKTLKTLPYIGKATSGSILAFAFNKPEPFIETNIRRVFIYFFFPAKKKVSDADILPLVDKTLDRENPRKWYYALMDYGVMLKQRHPELTKRSSKYRKQKPFKGSNREVRGKLLKSFLSGQGLTEEQVLQKLPFDARRIKKVLKQLIKEGFIKREKNIYRVS
jgi:A/G-specific adenine glycosylase